MGLEKLEILGLGRPRAPKRKMVFWRMQLERQRRHTRERIHELARNLAVGTERAPQQLDWVDGRCVAAVISKLEFVPSVYRKRVSGGRANRRTMRSMNCLSATDSSTSRSTRPASTRTSPSNPFVESAAASVASSMAFAATSISPRSA